MDAMQSTMMGFKLILGHINVGREPRSSRRSSTAHCFSLGKRVGAQRLEACPSGNSYGGKVTPNKKLAKDRSSPMEWVASAGTTITGRGHGGVGRDSTTSARRHITIHTRFRLWTHANGPVSTVLLIAVSRLFTGTYSKHPLEFCVTMI